MSSFKKEVKAIIAGQDVRDPRAALLAIERLCDAKITGPKKPARLLRIDVVEGAAPGLLEGKLIHGKNEALTLLGIEVAHRTVVDFLNKQGG